MAIFKTSRRKDDPEDRNDETAAETEMESFIEIGGRDEFDDLTLLELSEADLADEEAFDDDEDDQWVELEVDDDVMDAFAATGVLRPAMVTIRIPEELDARERADQYCDPLDAALAHDQLGGVAGSGVFQTAHPKTGEFGEAVSNVDLELFDLYAALPVVMATLREAGAPRGTLIEVAAGENDDVEQIPLLPIH